MREAAWTVEERVLWPGSDAASNATRRALQAVEPLHRLIQTKLAWPLSDRLADYGNVARTALATTAVVAAAAAGVAGTQLASTDGSGEPSGADPMLVSASATSSSEDQSTLSGVAPDFEQTSSTTTVAAQAVPPGAAAAPSSPPAKVAWEFAQAFVQYEVGEVNEQTASTFSQVADEPLAEALAGEPPRLPESAEVPKAEVLNVVLGERKDKELEVSVSLLRLKAASELRLTLRQTPEGWQVAEVRG